MIEELRIWYSLKNQWSFESAPKNEKIIWSCPKGHEEKLLWDTKLARVDKCKPCNSIGNKYPELAKTLDPTNKVPDPFKIYMNMSTPIKWICNCGHRWSETPLFRASKGCPECYPRDNVRRAGKRSPASENSYLMKLWDFERNKVDPSQISFKSSLMMYWVCEYGHSFQRAINNQRRETPCPRCSRPETEDEWERYFQTKFNFGKQWLLDNYINSENSLDEIWKNGGYSHTLLRRALKAFGLKKEKNQIMEIREKKRINTWIENYGEYDPIKHLSSPSNLEMEVRAALENLKINFIQSDRKTIAPKELDFLLSDLQVAIEFNGNHWHDRESYSEDLKNDTTLSRERQKDLLCDKLGITLLHIWQNEWTETPWESKESYLLGRINTTLENKG